MLEGLRGLLKLLRELQYPVVVLRREIFVLPDFLLVNLLTKSCKVGNVAQIDKIRP